MVLRYFPGGGSVCAWTLKDGWNLAGGHYGLMPKGLHSEVILPVFETWLQFTRFVTLDK
jgi:hypothetical protein